MGDHIRNVRLEQELLQREVAEILYVSVSTIEHWEGNIAQPQLKFYPSIIRFLGFTPDFCEKIPQLKNETFLKRIDLGLTQKQIAKKIGIDPSKLQQIEKNSRPLISRTKIKLRLLS